MQITNIETLKIWVNDNRKLIDTGDFQQLYENFFYNGQPQCLLSVLLKLSGFDIDYILNHFKDKIPDYSFCGDMINHIIDKPYILSGVIIIPKNISNIGKEAFRNQDKVTKYVILNNNISRIFYDAFKLKDETKKIIEFAGTKNTFTKAIGKDRLEGISKVICSDGEIKW